MLIAARNAFTTGGWVNPYVTDGLIAMWDGEWNAGGGVHDAAATTWKDLVGSNDISLFNAVINSSDVYFSYESYGTGTPPYPYGTIELILNKSEYGGGALDCSVITIGNMYSGWGICCLRTGLADTADIASGPLVPITTKVFQYVAFMKNQNATTANVALNGIVIESPQTTSAGSRYNGTLGYFINSGVGSSRASTFSIARISIYSKVLTAAEIAANYAVDKMRFNLP